MTPFAPLAPWRRVALLAMAAVCSLYVARRLLPVVEDLLASPRSRQLEPQIRTPPLEVPPRPEDGTIVVSVNRNGAPVPLAEVVLYKEGALNPNTGRVDWRLAGRATAGPDGRVRFGASPGGFIAAVRGQGFPSALAPVAHGENRIETQVDVVVPEAVPVNGFVSGAGLRPGNFRVRAARYLELSQRVLASSYRAQIPPEEEVVAFVEADGSFALALSPGKYRLVAEELGASSTEKTITVPSREPVKLELQRFGRIEGRVVGVNGEGAGQARVILIGVEESHEDSTRATGGLAAEVGSDVLRLHLYSGVTGSFSFRVRPGVYKLWASRGETAGSFREQVLVPAGGVVRDLTVKLEEAAALEGVVTSAATGAAVVGARIFVSPHGAPSDVAEAATDERGRYRAGSLPAGSYDVVFRAPGFAERTLSGVSPVAGQTFPLDAQLSMTGTIRGVMNVGGRSAEGCLVSVVSYDPSLWESLVQWATSDPNGAFVLRGVAPGRVVVASECRGALIWSEAVVEAGRISEVKLTVESVMGAVEIDASRLDAAPRTVEANLRSKTLGMLIPVAIDRPRVFSLEVPPGEYSVFGESFAFQGFTVPAGKPTRVSLRPPAVGVRRVVVVHGPTGVPVPNANVDLAGRGSRVTGITGTDGRLAATGPLRGPWVDVRARLGSWFGERAGLPNEAPTSELTVVLRRAGELAVEVRDVEGHAVGGFRATLALASGQNQLDLMVGTSRRAVVQGNRLELADFPSTRTFIAIETTQGRVGSAVVGVLPGQLIERTVWVGPPSTVTGRAIEAESGTPISFPFILAPGRLEPLALGQADGTFALTGVPAGEQLIILSGWDRSAILTEALGSGVSRQVGDVELRRDLEPGTVGIDLSPSPDGVRIASVSRRAFITPGTFEVGDILLRIGGEPVTGVAAAFGQLRGIPGSEVEVTVRTGEQERAVVVKRWALHPDAGN